jgi:hypothetical protein
LVVNRRGDQNRRRFGFGVKRIMAGILQTEGKALHHLIEALGAR